MNRPVPTIHVRDEGAALVVLVDWRDGRGPLISLSTPTYARALSVQLRKQGRAEAEQRVDDYVSRLVARHGTEVDR
jgi:hypothetical protein